MGIRIHKVLGYGLTNIGIENRIINDPRFSASSVIAGDFEAREDYTNEGFLKFIEDKKKLHNPESRTYDFAWLNSYLKDNLNKIDFTRLFIHDAEYGLGNVFCCVPLMLFDQWYRYDDAIDYFESTCVKTPRQANHVDVIKEPLYPFLGFCDSRDGRSIENVWASNYYQRKRAKLPGLDIAAKNCGFQSVAACNRYLKPEVPDCIRLQVEYANIFLDNSTINQLQPMIYTYWS